MQMRSASRDRAVPWYPHTLSAPGSGTAPVPQPRLPRPILKSSCGSRRTASIAGSIGIRSIPLSAASAGECLLRLPRQCVVCGKRIHSSKPVRCGPADARVVAVHGLFLLRCRVRPAFAVGGLRQECGCAKAATPLWGHCEARLRTLGVLGNKHIPVDYLRGSETQRRALLAGLLDTDGTVTTGGAVQFSAT